MNHKLFTTLSGLSISSLLMVVGLMANGQAERLPDALADSPLVTAESIDSDLVQTADETATPRQPKQRRGHASLSMPYFSFAQSLRPRG